MIDVAWAYDLLYNHFTEDEREHIEKNLLQEAVAVIQGAPRGLLNWQVWHDAGLAAAAFVRCDQALIHAVLYGDLGVARQIRDGLFADGMWHEQSIAYHMYTLDAFTWLAEMAAHSGYDVYAIEFGGRTFKSMYDAPLYHAFAGATHPSVGDSPAIPKLTASWVYGLALRRYRDSAYAWLLSRGKPHSRSYPAIFIRAALDDTQVTPHFAIGSSRFAPLGQNVLGSTLLADTGLVMMRGALGSAGPGAAVIYKPHGTIAGHQHAENLSLYLEHQGWQWLAGSGRFSYYPGQTDDRQGAYARHTAAKNSLVVDGLSQIPQCGSDGLWNTDGESKSTGQLCWFVPGSAMQLAQVASSDVYPGTKLTRTVLVTSDYVLDVYDAVSTEKHRYDWIIHVNGKPIEHDTGFAAHKDKLGQQDGMQFIELSHVLDNISSTVHTIWQTPTNKRLEHWFIPVGNGVKAMLGNALWSEAPGSRSVFVGESNNNIARFVSLFGPCSGDEAALVSHVGWLDDHVLKVERKAGWDIVKLPTPDGRGGFSITQHEPYGRCSAFLMVDGQQIGEGEVRFYSSAPTAFSAGLIDGVWVLYHAGAAAVDLTIEGIDVPVISKYGQDSQWGEIAYAKQGSLSTVGLSPGDILAFAPKERAAAMELSIYLSNS